MLAIPATGKQQTILLWSQGGRVKSERIQMLE